jgi:hypothetical protein
MRGFGTGGASLGGRAVVVAVTSVVAPTEAAVPALPALPPLPSPHAATAILKSIPKNNLVVFNFYLPVNPFEYGNVKTLTASGNSTPCIDINCCTKLAP